MAKLNNILQENALLKRQLSYYKESSGVFPYIDDGTIRGGYRVVKSIQDRDKIDCCHRKVGMVVTLEQSDFTYKNYRLMGPNPCYNNWVEVTTDGDVPGPPGPPGPQGPPGEISLLTFEIDDNMHLIMQIETNTNLSFSLNSSGHLILNN